MTEDPDPATVTPPPAQSARSSHDEDHTTGRLASPERVVTLSDGVFAIVVTILVLDISVADGLSERSLSQVLEELRPTLLAWVVSFLIAGMFWVAHRDLFSRVRSVDRNLVWLNLLFLLPVSLIPFAASMLGKYPDEPIAVHLYGVVMIVTTVMRTFLYWYVIRRPALLWPDVNPERPLLALAILASPIIAYALAMAVAGVSATLSIVLYLAVPVLYFLLVTLLRGRASTRAEADEFT
jgi:uncharacterized membrane protein